jgi:hypothetical protein
MSNAALTDEQWQKIFSFLQDQYGIHLGQESDCRRFVDAVLWVLILLCQIYLFDL